MSWDVPLLTRLLTTTGALASLIAGLLLSGPRGHAVEPSAVQASLASPEMIQLLRDEHGLVANMLKAQLANEKKDLATQAAPTRKQRQPAPRQVISARYAPS